MKGDLKMTKEKTVGINEILGEGNEYTIDGKKYAVKIGTLKELKKVSELSKVAMLGNISLNFVTFTDDKEDSQQKRLDALYEILGMAFGGQVPAEKFDDLQIDEVDRIVNYFRYYKRS